MLSSQSDFNVFLGGLKKIAKESQYTKDYARAHPIKILFNPANLSHPPPAESPSLYFIRGAALLLEPFFLQLLSTLHRKGVAKVDLLEKNNWRGEMFFTCFISGL